MTTGESPATFLKGVWNVAMRYLTLLVFLPMTTLPHCGCAAQSEDTGNRRCSLELITCHRRAPWKVEIPVDLDRDGRDDILLLTDPRRGGHEPASFQVMSSEDVFLVGPHLVGRGLEDLRIADVDDDGSAEITLFLRNPPSLQFVNHKLDSVLVEIVLPATLCDTTGMRIQGAYDLAGSSALELVLSCVAPSLPPATTLVALQWRPAELLWALALPGSLLCPVLAWTGDGTFRLAAAHSSEGCAELTALAASGEVIDRASLAAAEDARASMALVRDPQGGSRLATLTTTGSGQDATLAVWQLADSLTFRATSIEDAEQPILACPYRGEEWLVIGTRTGNLLLVSQDLSQTMTYPVPADTVRPAVVADLDLDGHPEIVCRAAHGVTVCLSLPDGRTVSHEGSDEVFVLRNGFGQPPTLVVRRQQHYHYFRYGRAPTSVLLTLSTFLGLAGVIVGGGCLLGVSAANWYTRRRTLGVLRATSLPGAALTRKGRLLWTNDSLRALLGPPAPRAGRPELTVLASRAGFQLHLPNDLGRTPGPKAEFAKDRRRLVLTSYCVCRDVLGRRVHAAVIEEAHTGSYDAPQDAWAGAARELIAQMRNTLSTVRLTSQWILSHMADAASSSAARERLRRLLTEAGTLQRLVGRLTGAAALAAQEKRGLDPMATLRESVRALESTSARRIRIAPSSSRRPITGNQRQLVFALQTLYDSFLEGSDSAVTLEVGLREEQGDPGRPDYVVFEIHRRAGEAARGSAVPSASRHAIAVATAVAHSHAGDLRVAYGDRGAATIELTIPYGSER